MRHREPSASESYYWPTVWAVALHILIFGMLFVSFAMTPDLPESRPIVQATLYQLKSKSQATQQTNQKLAGEAKKSAARQTEVEQMEQKKVEQEEIKAAQEQKKADAAQKAEQAKAADEAKKADAQAKAEAAKAADDAKKADEAKKADDAKKAADAKKAEQADIAKKKAEEEEEKKEAEEAKKQAAEDAKKKAAEDAKKQAAEDAKKKAADDAKAAAAAAAADAKKKAAEDAKKTADAAKKKAQDAARKSAEEKKAQALADLLSDKPERQQALAEEQGDQTAGNYDDLIRSRAAEGWTRPPSARKGMTVVLQINMLPDGTVTSVSVAKSSGDGPYDASAVAAVKNIGRLTEMQGLKPNEFNPYRSFKMTFTPEDLAL